LSFALLGSSNESVAAQRIGNGRQPATHTMGIRIRRQSDQRTKHRWSIEKSEEWVPLQNRLVKTGRTAVELPYFVMAKETSKKNPIGFAPIDQSKRKTPRSIQIKEI
jgi:hypothetical protein